MKRLWKTIIVSALVLLTVFAVSGCGTTDENADTGGTTTLTFRIWDTAQKDGMEKIAQAYMEKNPNIKIEVQVTSWDEYWTKLEAGVTSGTAPDIFWMHPNEILEYADAGILADCSSIVDESHYSDNSINLASGSDGTLYGVPKDKDTVGLVYNKELFDAAGVSYPNADWTWDDLTAASEKIYDTTGKYGFMAYADEQLGYWNFVYQAGGYIVDTEAQKAGFEDEATKEALEFYINLQKNDWCPDQNYFAQTSPGDTFFSGNGAMFLEGDWNILSECENNPEMNGKWDVAVLPKCPNPVRGDGRASVSNGLCNATTADGKHKEEAMDFLEFLGSEEAQRIQGESGAAIPAYIGLEQTWVDVFKEKNYDIDVENFIEMFDYAVTSPIDKSRPSWKTAVNAQLLKIYSGSQTYEEGLQNMQDLVDQAMLGY